MKRKALVLSGKRGGYGAMKQLMQEINKSLELDLYLVLTDQHLSKDFGYTLDEVRRISSLRRTRFRAIRWSTHI